jgi:hypothetical protein
MKIYLIRDEGNVRVDFSSYIADGFICDPKQLITIVRTKRGTSLEKLFGFLEEAIDEELISRKVVESINDLVSWVSYEATNRKRSEIPHEVNYDRITLIKSRSRAERIRINFLDNNPLTEPGEEIIAEYITLSSPLTTLTKILRRHHQVIGDVIMRGLNELVQIIWQSFR